MPDICTLSALAMPCLSCPWRLNATAQDIPNFNLDLAENLAVTCPDEHGMGPDFGASMFACHQSKEGREIACAGWMATVGHRHPGARLAVAMKRLDASALRPGAGWPALHPNYQKVLEKLRATTSANEPN